MNFRLKERIVKNFGTQADFAQSVKEHEAVVSRVVRGRFDLPSNKKKKWAKALKCDEQEIFGAEEA